MPSAKPIVVQKWIVRAQEPTSGSKGTHEPATYEMAPFDLVQVDLETIAMAFLFRETQDPDTLRLGLERLLTTYPILAGRFKKVKRDGLHLQQLTCSNHGVPFMLAKAPWALADFQDHLPVEVHSADHARPPHMEDMDINKVNNGKEAPCRIKLTQLQGGGSVVAVTFAHTGLDAGACIQILLRWCSLAGGNNPVIEQALKSSPLFDRAVLIDALNKFADGKPPVFKDQVEQCMFELLEKVMTSTLEPGKDAKTGRKGLTTWQDVKEWVRIARTLGANKQLPMAKINVQILHVPAKALANLKALLQSAPNGRPISTENALSALTWHVVCGLRGRPAPGSGAPGCGNFVGPMDLRGWAIPSQYAGVGYLPLVVPGGGASPMQSYHADRGNITVLTNVGHELDSLLVAARETAPDQPANEEVAALAAAHPAERCALAATAARIRAALNVYRNLDTLSYLAGPTMKKYTGAHPAVVLKVLARSLVDADIFCASWTKFPFLQVDFGHGAAAALHGMTTPQVPWMFMWVRAPDGGMYVQMALPDQQTADNARIHPWWQQFLPGCRFMDAPGPRRYEAAPQPTKDGHFVEIRPRSQVVGGRKVK